MAPASETELHQTLDRGHHLGKTFVKNQHRAAGKVE
jgi:hypothetical protein